MRWLELIGFLMILVSIGACTGTEFYGTGFVLFGLGFIVFIAGRFKA